ncbi:MAG TPA: winged helix DNA-binding domain-containing protein [Thermoanaerobaculia bacterium]|nr:winged helix DNA-binding domain-containing protein [Thermoanaerobaculia bacterium]
MAAAAPLLTARELNRATLARQMLLARERETASGAVARLVGLQAQLARPPLVGLWTRLEEARRDDLLGPLRRREVVRATAMRGTLHLMTAEDYAALRGALQPALTRGLVSVLGARNKALDLAAVEAEGRAFFAGRTATFDELRAHLGRQHPQGDVRAMAYAIRLLVPLIQLPTADPWGFPAQADFVLADEWLGKDVHTAEASADGLVLRYLAAFGPATPGDAQVWSALAALREAFARLRPKLVTFRDERKRELFDLPDAPRPAADTPAPVRFLPEFDNVLLSHDDRTRIFAADAHRARVVLKNLQVRATFLVDGLVAGTWKIERKKTAAALVVEPFGALTKKTKQALETEGDALLRFAEEDAAAREVRWSRGE